MVEPKYIEQFEKAGFLFTGRHPTRPIMQMLELRQPGDPAETEGSTRHPFFIGAQFHPELTSRPLKPQPMFMGLLAAAIERKFSGQIASNDPYLADLNKWTRRRAGQPVS